MSEGQHLGGAPGQGAAPRAEESLISTGLKVVGNLESEGDIVISGTVEGDIHSRGLTVSQGASVNGSIKADVVTILGSVQGEVNARSVGIAKTGEMSGDVIYGSLAIEDGAVIEGNCRRAKEGADTKVSKLKAVEGGASKTAPAPARETVKESKPEAG
jgi:cytoskeletal protein CcmA (bactofilin family)